MEIKQKKAVRPADDFIRIQDLWSLFVPRWGWFILSLAFCLGVAALYLARTPNVYTRYADFSKFKALHELGYLPIAVYGVPEGTLLPVGIPDHVIFNTDKHFAWLPQYLEDV